MAATPPTGFRQVDPTGMATFCVGTALWLLTWAVLLVTRDELVAKGRAWWLDVPPVGVALGLAGIAYCRRRAEIIRRVRETEGG